MASPCSAGAARRDRTQQRDAVEAVYSDAVSLGAAQTQFTRVDCRQNSEQARALPAGLVNNDQQWTLWRSASAALCVEHKHAQRWWPTPRGALA